MRFYFLFSFLLYFVCVGGSAECKTESVEVEKRRPERAKWRTMKEPTSKSIVGNYQHTHTQAHTHKHIWAARYGFDGSITLQCLIHECFPPFWSQTWKQEFCWEKKQNGWTHQYSDNAQLPVRRACARKRRPDEDISLLTACACRSACICSFASNLPFMWGFVIAMLFLCSSSRRKHNKSLFYARISSFSWAEPRKHENRGVGGFHFVNSSSDDGWVDAS